MCLLFLLVGEFFVLSFISPTFPPMRELKYHEKKLLKKVNFLEWKKTNSTREHLVTTKYLLKDREDYKRYNLVVGMIRKLTETLSRLADTDTTKMVVAKKLINLLYDAGILSERKLVNCSKVNVSSFCERRLPVVMVKMGLIKTFTHGDEFVQHGHVRVGMKTISDPSMLISRSMEEYITWTDSSKIRRKIEEFNDAQDDYGYV